MIEKLLSYSYQIFMLEKASYSNTNILHKHSMNSMKKENSRKNPCSILFLLVWCNLIVSRNNNNSAEVGYWLYDVSTKIQLQSNVKRTPSAC